MLLLQMAMTTFKMLKLKPKLMQIKLKLTPIRPKLNKMLLPRQLKKPQIKLLKLKLIKMLLPRPKLMHKLMPMRPRG
ncbi:hypothetical protein EFL85_05065 [Pediococcus pentosaceus]|nr:hypothetical protein [Pediococcus pentosaceus]